MVDSAPPAVLLVEDDSFTRSTLSAALQRYGVRIAAAVGSSREALALEPLPAAALLDLDLGPGPSGIDLAIALRERNPSIALVLLTTYDDPRFKAATAVPPRGMRFLRKPQVTDVAEIVDLLRAAMESPLLTVAGGEQPLSPMMIDTLQMVAEGLSTPEIARRRGVTEKAVEATITRLCEQFGLERLPTHNQRVRLAAEYYSLTGQVPR